MCGVCTVQDGITALHDAASGGSKEVVELLLGAGADANAADKVACCDAHGVVCGCVYG